MSVQTKTKVRLSDQFQLDYAYMYQGHVGLYTLGQKYQVSAALQNTFLVLIEELLKLGATFSLWDTQSYTPYLTSFEKVVVIEAGQLNPQRTPELARQAQLDGKSIIFDLRLPLKCKHTNTAGLNPSSSPSSSSSSEDPCDAKKCCRYGVAYWPLTEAQLEALASTLILRSGDAVANVEKATSAKMLHYLIIPQLEKFANHFEATCLSLRRNLREVAVRGRLHGQILLAGISDPTVLDPVVRANLISTWSQLPTELVVSSGPLSLPQKSQRGAVRPSRFYSQPQSHSTANSAMPNSPPAQTQGQPQPGAKANPKRPKVS